MKETILNQIILKTGDTIQIQEPLNLPMNQKIMYKIEHEEDKVVVHSNNGNIVIPVENILFATSVDLSKSSPISSIFIDCPPLLFPPPPITVVETADIFI